MFLLFWFYMVYGNTQRHFINNTNKLEHALEHLAMCFHKYF